MTRRRTGPPSRRSPTNRTRHSILVCVEGAKTEDLYLTHWTRLHRDRVTVDVDTSKTAPLSIVRHAIERQERESTKGSRRRGENHDEVWCMFDVDEHPDLDQALGLAQEHDISVALSNPCLELWFLLHFKDQTAFMNRHKCQSESAVFLKCGKVLTPSALALLVDRHDAAPKRARELELRHVGNGSAQRENPSSNVWELIDRIRG